MKTPVLALLVVWAGTSASLALDSAAVQRAAAYSRTTGHRALIIEEGGRELHRGFAAGGGPDRLHHVRSVSKSLWALALVRAEDRRILRLDEVASAEITEWRKDSRLQRVTLRHLLSLTSGISPETSAIYSLPQRSIVATALRTRSLHRPGEEFEYGPAAYEIAVEFLRRRLARRGDNPEDFLTREILRPAGVRGIAMRKDLKGTPYRSAGVSMSAEGLLELARLYGPAGPRMRFPARGIRTICAGSSANPAFGLGVWLNTAANRSDPVDEPVENYIGKDLLTPGQWSRVCIASSAPPDLIVLLGSSGQRAYISPSGRLLIVRLGEGADFDDAKFWRLLTGSK